MRRGLLPVQTRHRTTRLKWLYCAYGLALKDLKPGVVSLWEQMLDSYTRHASLQWRLPGRLLWPALPSSMISILQKRPEGRWDGHARNSQTLRKRHLRKAQRGWKGGVRTCNPSVSPDSSGIIGWRLILVDSLLTEEPLQTQWNL